mmetsp:Transcript_51278/g.161261  ORF Transcript_51278/g.161261 Transcript_51278/m.161261 type:complete len:202 (-) Transcript_51278:366-971(-)
MRMKRSLARTRTPAGALHAPRARAHGRSGGAVRLEHLDDGLLPVLRGHGQRRLALRVGLAHGRAGLQQVLHQLLPAVARGVVQTAVPGGVHGVGVRPVVQQQLDNSDAVGADRIAQRSDALVVLPVQGFPPGEEVLHGLEVAVLGGLVQRQGRLLKLLHRGGELAREPAHPLAELQHELLVLVVAHGGLHAVFLDVLEDGR